MKEVAPQGYPPPQEWPVRQGPDCSECKSADNVTWLGAGVEPATGASVNLWRCGNCRNQWPVPITHWPVLDGPDCPICQTPGTVWSAIAAQQKGDLWVCDDGHEFVVTIEGLVIPPEGEEASS